MIICEKDLLINMLKRHFKEVDKHLDFYQGSHTGETELCYLRAKQKKELEELRGK